MEDSLSGEQIAAKLKTRKNKKRAVVSAVVFAAIGLHALAAFIAGAIFIVHAVIKEADDFEEAPVVAAPQKQPLYQVNIARLKRQSSPPRPRLIVVHNPNNIKMPSIDVPKIDMDIAITGRSSGGFGVGVGGGQRSPSLIQFKGIVATGQRLFFVFDRSTEIMKNSRGGFYNYNILKKELQDIINKLAPSTLFNALTFTPKGNMLFNKKDMQLATSANKKALTKWVDGINKTPKDVKSHNKRVFPSDSDIEKQALYGRVSFTRGPIRDLAAAMNQQANPIFYVSTDFPEIIEVYDYRELTSQEKNEMKNWFRKLRVKNEEEFKAKHYPIHKAYHKKVGEMLKKLNEQREKKGLPPMVAHSDIRAWRKTLPFSEPKEWDKYNKMRHIKEKENANVLAYLKKLLKIHYLDQGLQKPSLNIVLFRGEDEEIPKETRNFAKRVAHYFGGEMKVIKGLKATD